MTHAKHDRLDLLLKDYFRPGAAPAGLAARVIRVATAARGEIERLEGELCVETTPRGVVRVARGPQAAPRTAAERRLVERTRLELREYLAGVRTFFSVPLDLSALPGFQRRVLEAAAQIPFGAARPYAWVARRIGSPRAVRAVGTALAKNPVPFLVPCHRVVRSDGSSGGYALGARMKAGLLRLERTTPVLEGCTSTRIVCRVGCVHGRRMKPDNRVVFASVDDARAVGYRPCRVCRPAAAA